MVKRAKGRTEFDARGKGTTKSLLAFVPGRSRKLCYIFGQLDDIRCPNKPDQRGKHERNKRLKKRCKRKRSSVAFLPRSSVKIRAASGKLPLARLGCVTSERGIKPARSVGILLERREIFAERGLSIHDRLMEILCGQLSVTNFAVRFAKYTYEETQTEMSTCTFV